MDHPASPAGTPRLPRILAPLLAGAVAAGGSLVGLAAAVALQDRLEMARAPVPVWTAFTAVALILGVLSYRGGLTLTLAHLPGRLLGTAVCGFVLAAVVFFPVAAKLGRPTEAPTVIAAFGLSGLALVALGLVRRRRRSVAPDDLPATPPAPGGSLPAPPPVEPVGPGVVYALAPTGPALTAEESERDAPAVEVRVLWGSDVLHVAHLDPPRAFTAGDLGSDVVVDPEALGAWRASLVAVGVAGPSALVPPGATALVRVGTRLRTLESAIADGLAQPRGEGAVGAAVALAPGMTVTLVLPSRGARAAYRAPGSGAEPAGARLAFEIALVRAGHRVGRAPSLRGAARVLASTALAACVAGGGLAWLAATEPAPDPDDDGVTRDQMVLIQTQLQAVDEREMEEPAEGEEPPVDARTWNNADPAPMPNPSTRLTRWDLWPWVPWMPPWDEGAGLDDHPFELPVEAAMLGPRMFCGGWADPTLDMNEPFPDPRTRFCRTAVVTPFGLRSPDVPRMRDILGRDPGDPWPFDYERARHGLKRPGEPQGFGSSATSRARIYVADPLVVVGVTFDGSARAAVPAPRHDLRACYGLGLTENPSLRGAVTFRFAVGRDGVLHLADARATLPDARVKRCVQGALEGLRVAPPPQMVSGTYRVDMKLVPARRP